MSQKSEMLRLLREARERLHQSHFFECRTWAQNCDDDCSCDIERWKNEVDAVLSALPKRRRSK